MFKFFIVLLIPALLLIVAIIAIQKGYNVQIKNKLLGEIKLEKSDNNGK